MENGSTKDPDMYLEPTSTLDSDNEKIIETARAMTRNCSGTPEKAVKLFYFVRDSIAYNLYMISLLSG